MKDFKHRPSSPSRRSFLATAGASVASLLAAACGERQPPEEIVPYARIPEYIVPGRPLWFASAVVVGGYAYGALVESHEGRPTKIEGHPEHPSSLGATDAFGQALIRGLVDESRTRDVLARGLPSDWSSLLAAARAQLSDSKSRRTGAKRGAVAILSGRVSSPSTARMIAALRERYPGARWYAWEPIPDSQALAGSEQALGRPLHAVPRLDRARVVVSLDDDLFADRPGRLAHARAWTRARDPARDSNGSPGAALRLYAAESFPTITGAVADHRVSLRHGEVDRLAHALLLAVQRGGSRRHRGWVELAADDLRRAGREALVVAGTRQSPRVHAIAHALNHLLGAPGRTVDYYEPFTAGPTAGVESLRELAEALRAGEIATLLLLDDVNPVYDAPPELELERLIRDVPLVIHHGLRMSETGALADWHVPAAHTLESWADARGHDGTPTLIQPLIRPLFGGRTAAELIAALLGEPASARELVRETWRERVPSEAQWREAVHDGRLVRDLAPVETRLARKALSALERPSRPLIPGGLELAFRPDPTVHDGRFAANPWLQELPKPISSLAWGNAAFVARETAARLGLEDDQLVELELGGRAVRIPVRVLSGHPLDQVTVHFGHGRRVAGAIGTGQGTDVYPLRSADGLWLRTGLRLRALAERRPVIAVQHHHRMHGRDLVREASRAAYGETLGEAFASPHDPPREPPPSLHPDRPLSSPAWAMSIDLGACIGCNACVVACQAENNIPTVGPEQVRMGREMHWIRVDRYDFEGEDGSRRTMFQPVPCMQCEHAPCEVVCPTGATVHSDSGLNDMVYNRCVGTRYCNNNCPYKVRRFNFYRYAEPDNDLLMLSKNPNVTIRAGGVMEKCTYCVQRIQAGRRAARREGRSLRDGDVRTACQQACPTRAIVFGDLGDPEAAVVARKAEPRSYALLAELNTRPRTTYLGRLRNPHPATLDAPLAATQVGEGEE